MEKNELLHQAAVSGSLEKVRNYLAPKLFGLIKPADVNARNLLEFTPIYHAASYGFTDIAKLLIEKGADVNVKDKESYTPLMASARYGHFEVAELLVAVGADIHATKTGSDAGWTPLIYAAINGHEKIVKLLVKKGADVNAKSEEWLTALMGGAKYGYKEIVANLLEHGADVHISKNGENIGWTALMFAAWQGHAEVVDLLIKKGAQVDVLTAEHWTPLMWAAKEGHTQTVEALIKHGAQIDMQTNDRWTPLLYAARGGHKLMAEALLRQGANPNHSQKDGWTPLILAAYNGSVELAKLLLDHGADVHHKDLKNETAMDNALEKKDMAMMALLEENGAEPPETHDGGLPVITAAHLAIHLMDSSTLGQAGAGGSFFQNAIQNLNNQDNEWAARNFKLAIDEGLDTLRQGYAYANLGTLKLKNEDLKGALTDFLTVLNFNQALYESVHEAVQYLYIVYQELGRTSEAEGLRQLYSRTSAKLGMSLSPDMATKVRKLVQKEKNQFIPSQKKEKQPKAGQLTKGLRPLGNKKRLTQTNEEDPYDAYFLLFRDKPSATQYYSELVKYARKVHPPIVLEVMLSFAPRIIFEEKYVFTYPNPGVDQREEYQKWMREAILFCNDRGLPHNHTDSKYRALATQVEEVYKWDILVPAHFSASDDDGKEFLCDPENGGYPELKLTDVKV